MLWDHELSDQHKQASNQNFFYGSIQPGTAYRIIIDIEGSNESAFERYLGCLIFGFMPNEGLREAVTSLRDIFEFYSQKPIQAPARLMPKSIDASIGDRKKRPDLIII